VPWISIALFVRLCFTVTMGKTSAALPYHRERASPFIVAVAESLVMLVNEFVLSTQIVVQNSRDNLFVRNLRAATWRTLIL